MIEVALKLRSFEIAKIKSVGIIAKIKAKITTNIEELIASELKQIIATQAPHAAPCETPIVLGAASGLPRLLCNMHPQIPKTAPAISEHSMWGSRKFTSIK